MGLNSRIDAAVSGAVGAVMDAYARERVGVRLPRLSWALVEGGVLVGHAGADCAEDEVGGVLARWAGVLNLTSAPVSPRLAGSVAYDGTVEGCAVHLWGVIDRDTWENPGGTR